MAWFVYDENSVGPVKNDPELERAGVTLADGNPLLDALGRRESVLLLPGTVADAPFVLHIENRRAGEDEGTYRSARHGMHSRGKRDSSASRSE